MGNPHCTERMERSTGKRMLQPMKRSGGDRSVNNKSNMNRIFFTADLHFGHWNILRYQMDRSFANRDDTATHDAWLLNLWRSTVDKKDMVYILGDLTFFKSEDARHLLENCSDANTS